MEYRVNTKNWTYGCEHELADWDTRWGWEGYGRDPEPNIVNSNGIAADPLLKSYPFGGEINTPPSSSPDVQGELLERFLKRHERAKVNYRTGLHVHIRVPGLIDNLQGLKRLQKYIMDNYGVYPLVDRMPAPTEDQYSTKEEYLGARRRWNWMKMAHWTVIPKDRVESQLRATTVKEFFELEVPKSKTGKVLWHAQPRAAINLRQLLQTDTIEFRHFAATLSPLETITAIEWCRDFLAAALSGDDYSAIRLFVDKYSNRVFPSLDDCPYIHWMELRWAATSVSKLPRGTVDENIKRILAGEFDTISNRGLEYLNPRSQYGNDYLTDRTVWKKG